ncbi:MAG: UDP-N-acetylmuramoyl-L-alanine--D-glutamate ligase [Leptospirales bacterium]
MTRHTRPNLNPGTPLTILGAGRSGIAAARLGRFLGHPVRLVDEETGMSREMFDSLTRLGISVDLGVPVTPDWVSGLEFAIVSPGLSPMKWAGEAAPLFRRNIVGELEWAAMQTTLPMVVVGGTNGKSTTSALLAQLLEAGGERPFLGGNFGTPLSELVLDGLESDRSRYTAAVVELSSFQAETLGTLKPRVNLLLNVTPDHLDRYPSFEAYRQAKWNAFKTQSADSWAVLNGSPGTGIIPIPVLPCRTAFFSLEPGDLPENAPGILLSRGGDEARLFGIPGSPETRWDTRRFTLEGEGNRQNLAAALLGAVLFLQDRGAALSGLKKPFEEAVASFRGLPHRMEAVGEYAGVRFINDSKATNVDSTRLALRGFREGNPSLHLILGGRDKGAPYEPLREGIIRAVKSIVAIGEARDRIRKELGDVVPLREAGSLEEAVKMALAEAVPGDRVLLSPACSSYDMFHGYEERGQVFREIVQRIIGSGSEKSQGSRS